MNEDIKIKGTVSVSVYRAKTGETEIICKDKENLLTTAGRDWIHGQVYNSGTGDEAIYIGLSTNAGGASAAHTTLAGEIVAADLTRVGGTSAHTPGATTTTITKVFTAANIYTGIQLCGLFSAVAAGTLVHENTFAATNLEVSDQLTVTWTITLS